MNLEKIFVSIIEKLYSNIINNLNRKASFRRIVYPIYQKFLYLEFILTYYLFRKQPSIKKLIRDDQKPSGKVQKSLIFAVEKGDWSLKWDGTYITNNLNKLGLIEAKIASYYYVRNKIIHFAAIPILYSPLGILNLRKSNKTVVTWFHVVENDKKLKIIPWLNKRIDLLHTSNEIAKNELIKYGFDEERIVVIPLGIDLKHFKKLNDATRSNLKRKYNIPPNKIIIGSFQKDGVGLNEGFEPKLVKGPDIFCQVIKKLSKKFDIHIFLTGPSRGYVKNKLDEYEIPYTHVFLENFLDIVECYNILDLYLVTSRTEGGPKALLESMAIGVPIVTTRVGMAEDIIKDGENGFIANVNDINQIYEYSSKLLENKELRDKFISNGLKVIENYTWENIAKQYYFKLYKRLF